MNIFPLQKSLKGKWEKTKGKEKECKNYNLKKIWKLGERENRKKKIQVNIREEEERIKRLREKDKIKEKAILQDVKESDIEKYKAKGNSSWLYREKIWKKVESLLYREEKKRLC